MLKKVSKQCSENKLFFLILLVGSFSWILTMAKSGLGYSFGLGFWGANGHDGIWHIALANSLAQGSFNMPVFAGVSLQNYHIGFDLILALLSKTGIPVTIWYFQLLPIIFSLMIGILTYLFVFEWKQNKHAAVWSTFFVYFGGSFGWIVTLLRGQGIGGESMFWSQQAISTLINPPFALSIILFLLGLITLQKYSKKENLRLLIVSAILFGLLIEIKAYAGVLTIGGLFIAAAQQFLFGRSLRLMKVFLLSTVISIIVFLPLNSSASSLFIIQPGWFLETMLGISDRLYWPKAYEALMNWKSGHMFGKEVIGYLGAFIIFIVGNLGIRLVSFSSILSRMKLNSNSLNDFILVTMFIGGIVAPMLFLQNGTPWNTIQFFYYSLFIVGIYTGISVESFLNRFGKKDSLKYVFVTTIVLLTIPTTLSTLATVYLPGRAPAKISYEETDALAFLSKQPYGVVLAFPYDSIKAREAINNPPRPLYLYDSTAYVSAYAQKPTFLEDEVNLTITGYDWKTRRTEVEAFYKEPDQMKAREFLSRNNIKYIYWIKGQRALLGETQLGIERIFENDLIDIYSVN